MMILAAGRIAAASGTNCNLQPVDYLNIAAAIGRQSLGRVSPRPAVGALVVRAGQIVGSSATALRNGPHAEPQALEQAGALARGADLYSTLQPCAHHGQTPPCTEAIIASGIARCFFACRDPNPLVGDGIEQLRAAGIEVFPDIDCESARDGLKGYLRQASAGRPYVIAKWAMSLDGRIALPGGRAGYLSSQQSLRLVHQRRSEVDAVMIGSGTALADDPRLTVRAGIHVREQPLRVVLDRRARLTPQAAMLRQSGSTLVIAAIGADPRKIAALEAAGCRVQQLPADPGQSVSSTLAHLGELGIGQVLLEGGQAVLTSYWAAGAIDEVEIFLCPRLVGDRLAPNPIGELPIGDSPMGDLEFLQSGRAGDDLWIRARPTRINDS